MKWTANLAFTTMKLFVNLQNKFKCLYKKAAAQNSKCCGALHVRLQKHIITSIKKVAYVNKISSLWQQCL